MELETVFQPTRDAAIIQRKIAPPPLPANFLDRPRLNCLLAELGAGHRVVVVSATAGAGKTAAIVAASLASTDQTAWLSIDRTDAAAGRLITYLEAALARQVPSAHGIGTSALAVGIPHPEAAGLLAEAVGDQQLTLVLDELERLGDSQEAWAVIESLIRYAPPGLTVVLSSRRAVPVTLYDLPAGDIAFVGETDLAFTKAEAADVLVALGRHDVDAATAVELTGGWVTGVLFEAWRAAEHQAGDGGETDPLHGYLSSHILEHLQPDDREFLIETSLLDEVDAARAEALGLQRAGERLAALHAVHLPVSWTSGGRTMRCHTRFREYLLERLERRGGSEIRPLRAAYANLLLHEGHDEEATEEFLRVGDLSSARSCAERAIFPVLERLDLAVAERWLDALRDHGPPGSIALTTADLMRTIAREDFGRLVSIADELEARGERDALAAASDTAAWVLAWAYIHALRPADVDAVLEAAQPGPAMDAVRYAARVMTEPDAPVKPVRPGLTDGPVDAFVYAADWALGRLAELTETPATRWVEAVKRPWRIAALRATGQTQRALELFEAPDGASAVVVVQTFIGPELLADAGRSEDARRLLAQGRRLAHHSGSSALEGLNAIAEAKLALRLDRDAEAALEILERPECRRAISGLCYARDLALTWEGLALLLQSADALALERLREAVEGMVRDDRILELPTAAAYLAEAEWRAGNEEGADAAADLALDAARRQGSNHLLLQALADFPAVVSRRIDAEPAADSPWHELGRALIARGVGLSTSVRTAVELREFGERTLLVNGEETRAPILKTYELLAYLATRDQAQADRDELADALFAGRTVESNRAYLRQAVRGLRQALPQDAVTVEGRTVGLSDGIGVTTDSERFKARLTEATSLQGDARRSAIAEALATFDRGEYLPGVRSGWADERHRHLTELATDARYEAAELELAAGRYKEARRLAEQVVANDPFREAAWRLMMRVSDALGDEAGVLHSFQGCERALTELGTTPAPSTRQLLEQLRR